ncbi:MAG: 2-oxo acid dehydrogenase subunit E2, partial [Chitinophagaceae bacterium]|nr:2-oxo acid dehydrogenase subunit E2 [Chitinophagaceae bacterium]
MAEKILMPRLSDTMTEGVIAAWHKKVGDKVKKGDLLAEIETDKATMELESYKDGTLLHLGGDKGAKIQVDELLAIVGNDGEDISSLVSSSASLPKEAAKTEQPAPKKETAQPTTKDQPAQSSLDISKMDEVVLMPRLSDTMEEGVISSWHKNVGDTVKKGEVLADIETDKATLELESYKNGTLLHVGAQKGEKIPVNGLLCIIGEKGKVDVDAIIAAAKGGGVSSQPAPAESPKAEATETVQPAAQTAATSSSSSSDNGRVKASPLAKKLAAEKGIDIGSINGTGDGGRITKADIDNYKASSSGKPAATTAVAPIFTGSTEEGFTDIPNSQIRNIIAKRLGESKFSAPHFYLTMEINMDNAMAARVQLNEVSPAKISFNDMVVKATALALRQHPAVNASWLGDKIRRYNHIHIGIAVAIEDGLIVPVVKFA